MARIPDDTTIYATDGDRPMSIVRRVGRERERMLGMTDEERAWRKKWLEAQKLHPSEPVFPKEYQRTMYNPIRRFYKAPMDKFQNMLEPKMGYANAYILRHLITKSVMGIAVFYGIWYHLKFHQMDWTRNSGWKITVSRKAMYPDNKDLEQVYKVKGNQFYVNGFDKSPI